MSDHDCRLSGDAYDNCTRCGGYAGPVQRSTPTCGCGHTASEHVQGVGCTNGWQYDAEGMSTTDGCDCQWSHVDSPTEREWRAS